MIYLQNIREVSLVNCGLIVLPDMSRAFHLENVDVRDNNITEINEGFIPFSIRKLVIEGNPIEYVKIDCHKFPDLAEICCGSKCTSYISTQIMQKILVLVSENYRCFLCMPPKVVLGDEEAFFKYILNPEKYLIEIEDTNRRLQALQWLTFEEKYPFRFADFTGQNWVFEKHFDFGPPTFKKMLSLTLDKCNIRKLPNISGIERLKHLSLSSNLLFEFPEFQMATLRSLDIRDNPIEGIDFDVQGFPELKTLSFGSKQTRFIAVRVLNQFRLGKLSFTRA